MHYFKKSLAFKILIVFIILTMAVAGCGKKTNEVPGRNTEIPGKSAQIPVIEKDDLSPEIQTDTRVLITPEPMMADNLNEILENSAIDDDIKELLNSPDDYKELPETTLSKLHLAFDAGEITEEDHAKLVLLSGVLPDMVPAEYSGEEDTEHINYVFEYLYDNWDSLSDETKTAVEPFMIPINNPKSYYYSDSESKPYEKQTFSFFSKVNAATPVKTLVMHEFVVEGRNVTVQYYEEESWSEGKKLDLNMCVNDIEDAMYHSYSEHKTLLTLELSKSILIEIIPLKNGLYGQTWTESDRYRIQLSTKKIDDPVVVKATIAHELFHDFQSEMGLKYKNTDVKWLMEATATWSEHNTYEEFNTEHEYLSTFFSTLNDELINFGHNYEYSGYMPFYYFSDYGSHNIVPDILWTTVRDGYSAVRNYLTAKVSDMRNQYSEYALNNINMGVTKVYNDYGDLEGHPSGHAFKREVMSVDQKRNEAVVLEPGGIQYYYYIFSADDDIKHIDFEFDNKFTDNKYIRRQALIKIDKEWTIEDWSDVEAQAFCRLSELKNENLKAIVLIYSNANFEKSGTENPVDYFHLTTGRCPDEMKITIDATYIQAGDGSSWTATASITDTVKIIDHSIYVSADSTYKVEGTGVSDGQTILTTEGGGTGHVSDPKIDNSMVRLMMPFDETFDDMKKEWEKYGIKENIPKGGILVTVPSLDDSDLNGQTTLYMPEPFGEMQMDSPMPLDGLSQITSIVIPEDAWGPNGFQAELSIDYFNHKSPILDMFDIDFSKFTNMLDGMGFDDIPEMPAIPDMPAFSQPPGGLGDMGSLLPGGSGSGDDSIGDTMNALTSFMGVPDPASGITVTIDLKISGEYTKFK